MSQRMLDALTTKNKAQCFQGMEIKEKPPRDKVSRLKEQVKQLKECVSRLEDRNELLEKEFKRIAEQYDDILVNKRLLNSEI